MKLEMWKEMIMKKNNGKEVYCHSRCCGAHWELVIRNGIWGLECEKCGKPVGNGVSVIGPSHMGDCKCDECGEEIDTTPDDVPKGWDTMEMTPKVLRELKKAYATAVDNNQTIFTFQGKEFVTKFAKYLIEFIEDKVRRLKEGVTRGN